jgi:hypothetical protein
MCDVQHDKQGFELRFGFLKLKPAFVLPLQGLQILLFDFADDLTQDLGARCRL